MTSRDDAPGPQAGPGQRLKQWLGPMLAGLAIDGLDLITFGPVGLAFGLLTGGLAGYWLAPMLGFPRRARWLCAGLTAVYCTLPMTGFIPVATVAAGLMHWLLPERPADADEPEARLVDGQVERDDAAGSEGRRSVIDVDYEHR